MKIIHSGIDEFEFAANDANRPANAARPKRRGPADSEDDETFESLSLAEDESNEVRAPRTARGRRATTKWWRGQSSEEAARERSLPWKRFADPKCPNRQRAKSGRGRIFGPPRAGVVRFQSARFASRGIVGNKRRLRNSNGLTPSHQSSLWPPNGVRRPDVAEIRRSNPSTDRRRWYCRSAHRVAMITAGRGVFCPNDAPPDPTDQPAPASTAAPPPAAPRRAICDGRVRRGHESLCRRSGPELSWPLPRVP